MLNAENQNYQNIPWIHIHFMVVIVLHFSFMSINIHMNVSHFLFITFNVKIKTKNLILNLYTFLTFFLLLAFKTKNKFLRKKMVRFSGMFAGRFYIGMLTSRSKCQWVFWWTNYFISALCREHSSEGKGYLGPWRRFIFDKPTFSSAICNVALFRWSRISERLFQFGSGNVTNWI